MRDKKLSLSTMGKNFVFIVAFVIQPLCVPLRFNLPVLLVIS